MISSRTPEGEPNRCHVCGNDIWLDPSLLRDAPCPHCGQLLWWFVERADVERRIAEMRADSLDLIEIVMEIEDEYGITVSDDDYADLFTRRQPYVVHHLGTGE